MSTSSMRGTLFLAGMLVACPCLAQQQPTDPMGRQRGRQEEQIDKTRNDLKHYERVTQEAPTPHAQVEARIKVGESRVLLSRMGQEKKQMLQQATQDFEQVIVAGDPKQKARAQNNLGTLYLADGDAAKAIDTLKGVDKTQIEPTQRFVVHYNLARAYDAASNPVRALAEYDQTLRENPYYTRAVEQATKVIERGNLPVAALPATYHLGLTLVQKGQLPAAQGVGLAVLRNKTLEKQREVGLAILLRAAANDNREPGRWLEEEHSLLISLRELGYAQAAEEIQRVYKEPLNPREISLVNIPMREVKPFSWFSAAARDERVRSAFAALLNHVGDYFAMVVGERQMRDPNRALACYLYGWALAADSAAALNAALILSTAPPQFDPQRFIYDKLMDSLFAEKGRLYRVKYKSRADWENILRMHTLLGTIFEQRREWGSEDEWRSAIFQWTLALRAERQIQELPDGREFQAPGLHERLGAAYAAVNQPTKAVGHFLDASEKYVQRHHNEEARKALAQAEKLRAAATEEQKKAFTTIKQELELIPDKDP